MISYDYSPNLRSSRAGCDNIFFCEQNQRGDWWCYDGRAGVEVLGTYFIFRGDGRVTRPRDRLIDYNSCLLDVMRYFWFFAICTALGLFATTAV